MGMPQPGLAGSAWLLGSMGRLLWSGEASSQRVHSPNSQPGSARPGPGAAARGPVSHPLPPGAGAGLVPVAAPI